MHIYSRAIIAFCVMAAFAVQALVPQGYMAAQDDAGRITVRICGSYHASPRYALFDVQTGALTPVDKPAAAQNSKTPNDPATPDGPDQGSKACPFAAASHYIAAPASIWTRPPATAPPTAVLVPTTTPTLMRAAALQPLIPRAPPASASL